MPTHIHTWIWLFLTMLMFPLTTLAAETSPAPEDSDPFHVRWMQADGSVGSNAARSWLWGPSVLFTTDETGSNNIMQRVQYWDKGRMEASGSDLSDPWAMTGGLVGRELLHAQARLPIVGDDDPLLNPVAPTYADLSPWLTDAMLPLLGPVDTLLSPTGTPILLPDLAAAYPETHPVVATGEPFSIPQVFWDLLTSIETETATSWIVPIGHPLGEPAWTLAMIDGQIYEVLVQVYERRILTYTPRNPPDWRVELGNAGRHAYMWRYTDAPQRIAAQE